MVDMAKFLCAFLILFYHYFSEYGNLSGLLAEALSSYAIAVALFMGISGFLTFQKLEGVDTRKERWTYIQGQVCRILKIYLLWSIVYILYNISRWDFSDLSIQFVLFQLRNWIFNSTFYTIWFMPALAFGLLATFLITEFLPKWTAIMLAVLLYIIGTLQLTYVSVGNLIPGFAHLSEFSVAWLGGARGWLFYGFPLIMVGRYMAKFYAKRPNYGTKSWLGWMGLSVLSVGLMLGEALTLRHFCGSTGIDMTVMMPISTFCILGFLLCVKLPEGKYLIWMRKLSVLIFLTQRIFLTVIPDLLPQTVEDYIFANRFVSFFFVCGGTILFSAGILVLSKKMKWLRLLY